MSATDTVYKLLVSQATEKGLIAVRAACKQFLRDGGRAGVTPTKRKPIPKAWTLEAWRKQNGECKRCGNPIEAAELTGDHTLPLVEGGKHARWNVTAMHRSCNSSKGSKMPIAESKASGRTILEQIR